MKWSNEEQTLATHGNSSGKPEDLIRLGYATQEDYDNIEPYKTELELLQEQKEDLTKYLEDYIDSIARERGYDDHKSMMIYKDSSNTKFQQEGLQMFNLADAIWGYIDQKGAEFEATGVLPDLKTAKEEHPKWGDIS